MAKVTIKVDIDEEKIKKDIYLNDDVGRFAANSVLRHTTPYTPYLNGPLSKSWHITPWQISYDIIYANRQYNGKGFNFTKEKHPKATHKWTEIGFEEQKSVILQEIEDYIKGRI